MRLSGRSCIWLLRAAAVALVLAAGGCDYLSSLTEGWLPTAQEKKTTKVGQSLLDAAAEAERQGDYKTALAYYGSVYDKDQANEKALIGLSRNLRRLGRASEAEAVVGRALKVNGDAAAMLAEMGKVKLVLGKPLDAIEPLSRATALGNDGWDVELALAVAYDRISMYDKAERRYQAALEASPDNAVVLNNFGLSRAQAGHLDAGIKLLERATALPEATPKMRQNLALLYAMNGNFGAAETLVRKDLTGADAEANLEYYRKLHEDVRPGEPITLPDIATQLGTGNGSLDEPAAAPEARTSATAKGNAKTSPE